jgi:hypothetical protein
MTSICEKFRLDHTVNPHTNRKILVGGPTYNALVKECSKKRNMSKLCDMFNKNQTVNPETNNKIKVGGTVHKSWVRLCKEVAPMDVCTAFKKDKSVNPITGRKIKIGGPVYNMLVSKCEELTQNEKMVKKALGVSISETRELIAKWFDLSEMEKMFDMFKKIRTRAERLEVFGDVVYSSMRKLLKKTFKLHKDKLVKLFILIFHDQMNEKFGRIGVSISADILEFIDTRSELS